MSHQIEMLPEFTTIKIPDLWSINKKVRDVGTIKALKLKAGIYQVVQIVKPSQFPLQIYVEIKNGNRSEEFILRRNEDRNEDTSQDKPIGIYSSDNDCANVTKWIISSDFKSNSREEIIESWKNQVLLKKEGSAGEGLRTGQLGAVHASLAHWCLTNEAATIVMPTGTGKTETMMAITAHERCQRVLVIVPSDALRLQIGEKYCQFGILQKIGVLGKDAMYPVVAFMEHAPKTRDSLQKVIDTNVIVTTPSTLKLIPQKLKDTLLDSCSHLFFDEAHHIAARTWQEIKDSFGTKPILQFTATPFRNDNSPVLGKIIFNYPLLQAQKDGYFKEISLVQVNEPNPDKYDIAVANAAYERLLLDRRNGFTRHRVMVRSNNKEKAKQLLSLYQGLFPAERSVLVLSGTKSKKEVLKQILGGMYTFVICVDMLKEGFDFPELKIAAVHDLHKSLAVLLQFIGRFTRVEDGLGNASFIVNLEREVFADALESLFGDGTGWEKIIAEIASARQELASKFLSFLDGCKPIYEFDDPNIELHSKILRPALSTVMYKCKAVNWKNLTSEKLIEIFGKTCSITTPFQNSNESIMFFTVQRRLSVKWSKSKAIKDQIWDSFVLFHDISTEVLYIACSDNKFPHGRLADAVKNLGSITLIRGEQVFRSFGEIKRLRVLHAGLLKPANRRHRYSKFSGADVSEQLNQLATNSRAKKSDFVGIGYTAGKPVGIACSAKGKIWSPSKRDTIDNWKSWCCQVGAKVLNPGLSTDQIFKDRIDTVEIKEFPIDKVPIAMDWPLDIFDHSDDSLIKKGNSLSIPIFQAEMAILASELNKEKIEFEIVTDDMRGRFKMTLEGEYGQKCVQIDNSTKWTVELGRVNCELDEYLSQNPPIIYYADGASLEGCLLHSLPETIEQNFPVDQIIRWDWKSKGVNIRYESRFDKNGCSRQDSIQQYILEYCKDRNATFIFDDDGSGEIADVIAVFEDEQIVTLEFFHCKYSSESFAGARIKDLYEVCGQAIKSVKWIWNPSRIMRNIIRRARTTKIGLKRYFYGDQRVIEEISKTLKYKKCEFKIYIVQPGVLSNELTDDMNLLLSVTNSNLVDTGDCKLTCILS